MHIIVKVYEVALCSDDLQTIHTILPHTDTVLSPVYPSVMLHIAFKRLHLTALICRPSVKLCTVVKVNKTTTTASIIVLGRHWKEPETTATMMMVTIAVQMTIIVTSRSRVTMTELMMTVAKTAVTTTTTGVCNIENDTGSN